MKCAHCNNDNYLHVSASKDRLFYRFLLRRCLRCHYCGYGFFGTDLASRQVSPTSGIDRAGL